MLIFLLLKFRYKSLSYIKIKHTWKKTKSGRKRERERKRASKGD